MFFYPKLDGGGAEKQLSTLALNLSKKYIVYVGTFYEGGIWWDRLSDKESIRLISFDTPKYFKNINRVFSLYRFIKNEKIDILQSFLPSSNIIGNLSARLAGLKKCYSGIRSTSITYSGVDALQVKILMFIDSIVSSMLAKKIIYNSFAAMDYHTKKGFLQSKGVVIHNGYTFGKNEFDDNELEINNLIDVTDNKFIITNVSNINKKKDHMTLVRALNEISDYNFYCLLVGEIQDQKLYRLLLEFISDNKLTKKILFTNFIKNTDEIYKKSDLIISTSQEESFSNTIIEAMLNNKKILATNVGENSHLLANNRGIIIKVGDYKSLSKEIIDVIKNKDKINNSSSRHFILNNFSIKKIINSYEQTWGIIGDN